MSKCTMASLKLAALKISAALAANSGSHALSSLHLAREASVAHHLDVVRRKFSKRARDKSGWCLLHTIFARQFFFGDCFQGHVGKGWRRRSCIRGICSSGDLIHHPHLHPSHTTSNTNSKSHVILPHFRFPSINNIKMPSFKGMSPL